MLERFDRAVAAFDGRRSALDTALTGVDAVKPYTRYVADCSGYDVVALAPLFREVHLRAIASLKREAAIVEQRLLAWQSADREGAFHATQLRDDIVKQLHASLGSVHKGMFFFIRALQDNYCRIIMECHRSARWGVKPRRACTAG